MIEAKISNYYEIDEDGFVKRFLRLSETEKDIHPNFIKGWGDKVMVKPRYIKELEKWIETAKDYEIYGFKSMSDAKKAKDKELNQACSEAIIGGFMFEIKGIVYHFSYDQEAQINFQDTDRLFLNNNISEISWTVRKKGEKGRIILSKKIFMSVYLEGIKHKQNCLNHLYNNLLPKVQNTESMLELESVAWGEPSQAFNIKDNSIDTIINGLSEDSVAQKSINEQMEGIVLEIADIAISGF